jgi:hypothetical protein
MLPHLEYALYFQKIKKVKLVSGERGILPRLVLEIPYSSHARLLELHPGNCLKNLTLPGA